MKFAALMNVGARMVQEILFIQLVRASMNCKGEEENELHEIGVKEEDIFVGP
jgi:hypothetical protein